LATLVLGEGTENDSQKYDVILTAETIYSVDSYHKLHDVMKALLKASGCVYLAAKTYYFGVGGGTREFQQLVAEQKVFRFETVQIYSGEGVQRELMKLTFNNSDSQTDISLSSS